MTSRKNTSRNACATCKFWNGPYKASTPRDDSKFENTHDTDNCSAGYYDKYQRFADSDCPQWQKWSDLN
ncbi:MAG: hypothetical protein SAMD01599839_06750 [Rectinema sp.]